MHDINLQYTKENLFWHDIVWDPQRLKKNDTQNENEK